MLYRLDGVAVSFAGRAVLRDVTFQHNPGEKLTLLGRNGSGKTTILRVVAGELAPERGIVHRAAGLEIVRLEQILAVQPGMSVLTHCLGGIPRLLEAETELRTLEQELAGGGDEVLTRLQDLQSEVERLDGYRARPRAAAALQQVGIPPDLHGRPLAELSGGQRSRVALVRALLSPGLLLLDEPTNHLDLSGVEFLAAELAATSRGLLLVTHDRALVDRVGGPIMEVRGGRVERYPPRFERYRRERDARLEHRRRAWQLQQDEIRRQEEFVRRNIAGQNTRQAQARQALLDRMRRLDAPEPEPGAVKLRWGKAGRSGDRVMEVDGLVAGWQAPVVRGVSLLVRRGDRIAVVGRNGAGKTTLLRTLAGRLAPLAGMVRFGSGVVPAWYDQDQAEVPAAATVLAAVLSARPDWSPAEGRAWAGRFGFSGEAAEAATDTLSGGERARLALARLVAEGPNLLLLDEPTNHLDADTCEVLEEALREFPGGLLLVSHDRLLLERTCGSALYLGDGGAEVLPRVEDAFERMGLAPRQERHKGQGGGTRRSAVEEERRRLRRDAGRAREAAARLAARLEAGEARLTEVDRLLCEREVFSDPVRARALAEEADDLRTSIEELFSEWTEAEEDADALESRLAALEG